MQEANDYNRPRDPIVIGEFPRKRKGSQGINWLVKLVARDP
jgi:hypothetical protein